MSGLLTLATAGEGEQDFAARIRGRAMAGAAVAAQPPVHQERTEYPPEWGSGNEEWVVGDAQEESGAATPAVEQDGGGILAFDIGTDMKLVTEVLDKALTALGGDRESQVEDMSDIPNVCVVEAFRKITVGGNALPPMAIGKLMKWVRKCKEQASGTVSASTGKKTAGPAQVQHVYHVHNAPATIEAAPPKRKIADVLEQGVDAQVTVLSKEDLAALRDRYSKKLGGPHPRV